MAVKGHLQTTKTGPRAVIGLYVKRFSSTALILLGPMVASSNY